MEESSVDKVAEKVKLYFTLSALSHSHCSDLSLFSACYQVLARKDDDAAANGYEGGVELVLDQTTEFCRGLGEVDKIN